MKICKVHRAKTLEQ